ncbi:MFS transporter, partial [Microbacterium sp. ISL-103]|uniref:MFS transporter n=1 Tax=Microbacterium sp. ISL-103 TaxID=2819156 RepID=UPI0037C727D3
MTTTSVTSTVPFDQATVGRFHWRVAIASATGSYADGYILGVSGIALATVQQTVEIAPVWVGLLGSATLFGLFFGALICGRLVDRFGRRPFYGPL